MKRSSTPFLPFGLALTLSLVGCSGGSSGPKSGDTLSGGSVVDVTRGTGGAKINIAWPEATPVEGRATRLIPQQTRSVVVELFTTDPRSDTVAVASQFYWIDRTQNNITVGPIEARTYFVRITALSTATIPAASGTGNAPIPASEVPVASAVGTLVIARDRNDAHLDATLASTITSLQFTLKEADTGATPTSSLRPGKRYRLSIEAYDSRNRLVATPGNNFSWAGFGDAVPDSTTGASILVRFNANSNVAFTVRDLESGKDFANTLNTTNATFGTPGKVLNTAGPAYDNRAGIPFFDVVPLLNQTGSKNPQTPNGFLVDVSGRGPSNLRYGGVFYDPYQVAEGQACGGDGFCANGAQGYDSDYVPGGVPVYLGDGAGTYQEGHFFGRLVVQNNALLLDKSKYYPLQAVYPQTGETAPGTISGFDAEEDVVSIGLKDGAQFHVVRARISGSAEPRQQVDLTPVGTDPKLVGRNRFGDVYIQTTNNGRQEVRRYDLAGRLVTTFDPFVLGTDNKLLVSPSGKLTVTDAMNIDGQVYTEDGKIRLGSYPAPSIPFDDPDPTNAADGKNTYSGGIRYSKYGAFSYVYSKTFRTDQIGKTPTFFTVQYYDIEEVGK